MPKRSNVVKKAPSLEDEEVNLETKEVIPEEEVSVLMEIPLETLPINVTLPCTVYVKAHDKTMVFRRQGEKVNYKTAFEMQKKGTEKVYIHRAFWELFLSSLDEFDFKVDRKKATPGGHMQHLLMAYGTELEKRLKEPKGPMFEKLRQTAGGISKAILADDKNVGGLLRRSDDTSLYFVNHSVNTAVYVAVMAKKLGYSPEEIDQAAYAALVHDVGYLSLPKLILFKVSTLSADEVHTFQSHPKRGAELLHSVSAPGLVMRAVLQHHENLDGTGYPSKLMGEEIHPFAMMIHVADLYDDLTTNRPQARPISKEEAIKKLKSMGGEIDQKLVKLLPKD